VIDNMVVVEKFVCVGAQINFIYLIKLSTSLVIKLDWVVEDVNSETS